MRARAPRLQEASRPPRGGLEAARASLPWPLAWAARATLPQLPLDPRAAVAWLRRRWHEQLLERRWRRLRRAGLQLGARVNLPASTWIDPSHCHLISIGDDCGFGEGCLILAHDALANEFLDATRVGRVIIHPSCHFGARTVILPGVEIGPRTLVGAGSVVTRSLPPDSVAAGNPARVIAPLREHLERQRQRLRSAPTFDYAEVDPRQLDAGEYERLRSLVTGTDGFVLGGRSAALRGQGRIRTTGPSDSPRSPGVGP